MEDMKKSSLNTIIAGHFTKGQYDIVQLILQHWW